jgi:hypothetical protein
MPATGPTPREKVIRFYEDFDRGRRGNFDGDDVATIGHYRGHHHGELMGVPATGGEVDFTVMHVDRLRNGRIVEHRGIGDVNTMWTQLGVDPPSAQ